jgi:hypothetical protein
VPVPVFCCFCIPEKLVWKYSRIGRNYTGVPIFPEHAWRSEGAAEEGPPGGHTPPRARAPLCRALGWCGPLGGPQPPPFRLLIPPVAKTLSSLSKYPRKDPETPPSSTLAREGQNLFPAPCRRGESSPEASTSPCLPPEWCVSSSSLDYGSIAVARWLSLHFVPSCLDLVSCPTWSRSYYCNATCCVCWDPMNIEYYVKLIINLSLCYLRSCMLSVTSRCFGQVDACNSKREYLC